MIIFIAIVLVIGIFCVVVVCRDVVLEERDRKKKSAQADAEPKAEPKPEPKAEPTPEPTPAPEPAPAPVAPVVVPVAAADEQPAPEEEATADVDDDNVKFSAGSETIDEKYLALPSELKGYYDEIVRFANTVDGVKRYKNANYEEYKVGKSRLVRLKIKRGVVLCELLIPNLEFKNYVSDNKVEIKQAPTTIKLTDEASLSAIKDSIQIAINAIEEEKAYKKEQAKLRRAERRKQIAEGALDASDAH